MSHAVIIKNAVKKYGDFTAVNGISLNIEQGEFFTLLGPSGCGKTTLLRMIAGFNTVDGGEICFDEQVINNLPAHKRDIGMVFQNYAIFPHLNVADNVAYGLKARKVPKEQITPRVDEALRMVQIDQLKARQPNELSGGQQQRVALARAFVIEPGVLLMDEPLSNLDARLRLQTREEIRRIQRETGITTIFVTHDQEEAMSISDMIVVMKEGIVQQIGRPQEVYDNPRNLFVAKFLGTPPINVFEGQVREGKLYVGQEAVLDLALGKENLPKEVYVGVRPEGFLIREDGPFGCELSGVEVMGRDISVVSTHKASLNPAVRAIVSAESGPLAAGGQVRFSLKPGKVFLFRKDTEERIL